MFWFKSIERNEESSVLLNEYKHENILTAKKKTFKTNGYLMNEPVCSVNSCYY